jgi:ATP-dependent Lon protease
MSEELAEVTQVAEIPVLALRDVVVYPQMVIPLFVGREKSIRCLDIAMESDKQVFLVAQKDAAIDDPTDDDVYRTGTVATILQMLKLPDGTVKVLVEGVRRAEITAFIETEEYLTAAINYLTLETADVEHIEILVRSAISQFEGYVKLNKKIPPEVLTSLSGIEDPEQLADTMAAHMPLKLAEKQKVLEIKNVAERLEHLMALMEGEIDLLQVEKKIRTRVKKQMEKSQREYYLNEQMKAIQKELGDDEEGANEAEQIEKQIDEAHMPKEAKEKTLAELKKLKMMSPMSAEATVVRSYIDWMISVPWKKRSKLKRNTSRRSVRNRSLRIRKSQRTHFRVFGRPTTCFTVERTNTLFSWASGCG